MQPKVSTSEPRVVRPKAAYARALRFDGTNHDDVRKFAHPTPVVFDGLTGKIGVGAPFAEGDWFVRSGPYVVTLRASEFEATYEVLP